MNELNHIAGVSELSADDMLYIDGGSKILQYAARAIGYVIGAISRVQELNGDTGQWMA
jgi:hypothetical protein